MCNLRYSLDKLKDLENPQLFQDYNILGHMYQYSKFDWFSNQSAVWNEKYRPEMVEFAGRSGFGYSFNKMNPEMMFNDG